MTKHPMQKKYLAVSELVWPSATFQPIRLTVEVVRSDWLFISVYRS